MGREVEDGLERREMWVRRGWQEVYEYVYMRVGIDLELPGYRITRVPFYHFWRHWGQRYYTQLFNI